MWEEGDILRTTYHQGLYQQQACYRPSMKNFTAAGAFNSDTLGKFAWFVPVMTLPSQYSDELNDQCSGLPGIACHSSNPGSTPRTSDSQCFTANCFSQGRIMSPFTIDTDYD